MKNTTIILLAILTVIFFLIGAWPLGVIGIILIYAVVKKAKNHKEETEDKP